MPSSPEAIGDEGSMRKLLEQSGECNESILDRQESSGFSQVYPNPPDPAMSQRRITSELAKLKSEPNSQIGAEPIADELFHLRGTIHGPEATPYEGGVFVVDMRLPYDYPLKPPDCSFSTKIYHPNVSTRGEICLDILKRDWNPGQSIAKVLTAFLDMLRAPDADNALHPEVACQYSNDRPTFDRLAREWTEKYAIAQ
jgi:ubiquitin-conjugating enzyme E2 D/E